MTGSSLPSRGAVPHLPDGVSVGAKTRHRIHIVQTVDDDTPWVTVHCPFDGTDPRRPCVIVSCPVCQEDSCAECLSNGHGAEMLVGCNYSEWAENDGVRFVFDVTLPVESEWDGDGYTLEAETVSR